VRTSLHHFAVTAIAIVIGSTFGISAHASGQQAEVRDVEAAVAASTALPQTGEPAQAEVNDPGADPVANPGAVVIMGKARFTILTPQLIRMEWAADGKFEDHASFVFLNRKLPPVAFDRSELEHGHKLVLKTSALTLTYTPAAGMRSHPDGRFTPENLTIEMTVDGKPVKWHPGLPDDQNLQGTTRTLEGAVGEKTKEPIEEGLISRSGWAVVDDSSRPLFDSADFSFKVGQNSPWPWVMERPAGDRQDWYFFGYGHDYRKALGDYVRVAGRIPLPPRFAFGTWWSRYWDYSDQEIEEIVRGFHENSVPLDVFVIDMGWHTSREQLQARGEKDQSGHSLGWSGYSWNKMLFPDPDLFLDRLHAYHLKTSLNLHPASGIQPWEDAYPAMARAMGIDPGSRQFVPFDLTDKKYATNYMNLVLRPLEKQGIDFWWLDWQQEKKHQDVGRESDVLAELRAFHRPAAAGSAADSVPSLGRTGEPSLPDRVLGGHGVGVVVAGVSAMVYGHSGQCGLCVLEPRHRRAYAGGGRSGADDAMGGVWRVQPDSEDAYDQESGFGTAHLGLSRAVFVDSPQDVPTAVRDAAVYLYRGAADLRLRGSVFAAALL